MTRPATAVFPAVTVEGNLLAAATLDAVAMRAAGEQSEADYGIRKGLSIRDEISLAFRVARAHVETFRRTTAPGPDATARFVRDLLTEAFGFDDLEAGDPPLALAAGAGRVPVVVVPPGDSLDRASEALSTDRRRSATFALQDHLNDREEALWGLATNGRTLRLMRDNASLTRPAWLEANLVQMIETEDIASFSLLWLTIHRCRFGRAGTPATDCALERWREAGAREGEAARDKLADQVEQALRALGSGFLAANPEMRDALSSGRLSRTDWFNELLRLVYRLIFLMVAEDRQLLHPAGTDPEARDLYARGYSLARLRELSVRRAAWDRHHDRYEGVKVVFRACARGEPELGLPALGGLFGATQLPTLETARLTNRALMEAIYRLGWLRQSHGLVPVNWRAMATEELGSVYESLLELQPQLTDDGRALVFAQDVAEQKGNQRKTTGSYYTPDSLVQALLDTALDPVLDRAEAAEDPAEALLALAVIDPACGSGHFLLSAARRIATRVARHRAGGSPSATDFRHALRDVARRCIHGVDRNPMAVELTKVALWIETVDPGRPLGFLDAQIRCGDSLLGVYDRQVLYDGIPDAAYKPLAGDDKVAAKYYQKANRDAKAGQGTLGLDEDLSTLPTARPFTRRAHDIRALPEDSVAAVEEKRRRFRDFRAGQDFHMAEMACDAWVAAFLLPKTETPTSRGARAVPTTEDVWDALRGRPPWAVGAITEAARRARAFHWPLEFPDVMAKGGFDVVIGNPPWEVMQLSDKEYFATRRPEIAALSGAARKRAIEQLKTDDPAAHAEFVADKRRFDAANEFARASGRFDLTARGKVNTYALFAELFARLSAANGQAGVIVPTGVATDATTAPFFADLVAHRRIWSLVDFENRQALFPAVDSRMKFCLLTLGQDVEEARFAFFLHHPSELAEPERSFSLSPEQIETINPNTRTAPVFRSRADAELTAKIYANAPVLIDEGKGAAGNPWGVEFRQGLFNMTSDSHLFRTAAQLRDEGFEREGTDWVTPLPEQGEMPVDGANAGELFLEGGGRKPRRRYVPLYEAKMIHQFDHRWAGYGPDGASAADSTSDEKRDPAYEPHPRYWVPEQEVADRLAAKSWTRGWTLGWRRNARNTDERTTIANAFSRNVGIGDSIFCLSSSRQASLQAALFGNLNALCLDFTARQKVSGVNMSFYFLNQFPILPPDFYTEPRLAFVTPRVLELTYTSHAMAPFARDLGHTGPPFPWDEARRAHLRAELDAFYARAYGLTRDELRYILDPADVKGPDYPSETFRVLKKNEEAKHGEYRTRRLVLEAWDRMEADGTFRGLGL
jgi:hypothetical protein